MLLKDAEKDYQWWKEDRAGYEAEMERRDKELRRQFSEYMGIDYQQPYKLSEQEIRQEIDNRTERLQTLTEKKAPAELLENEQGLIGQLINDLREGNYLITDEDRFYRDSYHTKEKYFSFNFTVNVPEKFK